MAAGLLLLSTAAAAQTDNQFQSYISVSGSASREVTPNEIYIGITIDESEGRNGKVTVAEKERQMTERLTGLGIDVEKDLQVGNMSGDLKNYILRRDKVQTRKDYVLKVGDAQTLAAVFASLREINISDMHLIKATRSDLDDIRMELRAEAMRNARATADTLAEAIGQKAGKAFMINDNSYYGTGTVYFNAMPMARAAKTEAADNAETAQLEFQDMKVECSVNVRFVLE